MKTWSFYREDTGEFVSGRFSGPASWLPMNTPAGCAAMEGLFDAATCRVDLDVLEVVPWEAPPDVDDLARRARADRDQRLVACDWTQLLDADLTEEELTAWRAYRQALRDVTAQAGFPTEISWPTPPNEEERRGE